MAVSPWGSTSHTLEEIEFGQLAGTPQGKVVLPGGPAWETCEIDDTEGIRASDGHVRCHWFQARANGPRGVYLAAESPGFYCPGFTPEAGYAAAQHAALVARLLADGWAPTGARGRGWWNATFRRAV